MRFIPRRGHRTFPRACIRDAGEEGEPSLDSEEGARVARLSLLVFVISLIDTFLRSTTTDTLDVGVDALSIFTSRCGMFTLGWTLLFDGAFVNQGRSFINQTVRDRESFYSVRSSLVAESQSSQRSNAYSSKAPVKTGGEDYSSNERGGL